MMTIEDWAERLQEEVHNGASKSDIIQLLHDYINDNSK